MNLGAGGTLRGEWQPASDEGNDFGCRGAGSALRRPRWRGSPQRPPRICIGLPSPPVLMSSGRTGAEAPFPRRSFRGVPVVAIPPPCRTGTAQPSRHQGAGFRLARTQSSGTRRSQRPYPRSRTGNSYPPNWPGVLSSAPLFGVLKVHRRYEPVNVIKQPESQCRFGDDQRRMHPGGGLTVADLDIRSRIAIS